MHAPDGFLNAGTALATAAISAGVVGTAARHAGSQLADRQVPLAGMSAAFVFAAQMVNFPVAAGTTGHLLGGALAAILLGPSVGAVVMAVVVGVQALVFADGGLTAIGYNVLNLAIVTTFGGYAVFRLAVRVLPATRSGAAAAAGVAAGASVVLSAMAFSLEWLFGATAPIAFDRVFGAMVGVHTLIGIGEGVLTAMVLSAIIAVRPDLVYGLRDRAVRQPEVHRVSRRAVVAGLGLAAVMLATAVSQLSGQAPDGLERVAHDLGITGTAGGIPGALFADYATNGLQNESTSLAVAGLAGLVIVGLVSAGLLSATRDTRRDRPAPAKPIAR